LRWLGRILSIIDNISDWSGKICSFAVPLIMLIVTYEVIARYGFNSPTAWAHDTVKFLFGGAFVLVGAYTLRHHAHVRIDIFYNRFRPRTRAILDLVTSVFFFSFCAVVLWQGMKFAGVSLAAREYTITFWHAPVYPVKMAIPVGGALLLLQGLAKFILDVITVTGREAP